MSTRPNFQTKWLSGRNTAGGRQRAKTAAAMFVVLLSAVATATAVPPTGDTGPGGLELTDGTSDLVLWLRADADVTYGSGTEVTGWADQSGYGHNAAGSGNTPNFVDGGSGIGGMAALQFVKSTGDYLTGAFNPSSGIDFDDISMTVVVKLAAANVSGQNHNTFLALGTSSPPLFGDSQAFNFALLEDSGFDPYWHHGSKSSGTWATPNFNTKSPIAPDTDPHIVAVQDTVTDAKMTLFVDGQFQSSSSTYNNPGTINNYSVGTTNSGWELGALVSEVIIYKTALNDAERSILDNALGAKYDLELATGEDRYSEGTGEYRLDVFGVGSTGSDSVTAAGAAGMGIEAGALTTDEWLLAGHAVSENTLVNTEDLPPGVVERWERVWFVDETGDADGQFTFDFSDGGLSQPADTGGYRLLYSSTNAFDFTVWESVITVNGDTVTFDPDGTSLDDGYYTLGIVPEPGTLSLALVALILGGLLLIRRRRA